MPKGITTWLIRVSNQGPLGPEPYALPLRHTGSVILYQDSVSLDTVLASIIIIFSYDREYLFKIWDEANSGISLRYKHSCRSIGDFGIFYQGYKLLYLIFIKPTLQKSKSLKMKYFGIMERIYTIFPEPNACLEPYWNLYNWYVLSQSRSI